MFRCCLVALAQSGHGTNTRSASAVTGGVSSAQHRRLALRIHVHIPMQRQALQLTQIFTFKHRWPVSAGSASAACLSIRKAVLRVALMPDGPIVHVCKHM
jgi:hypothetical protein